MGNGTKANEDVYRRHGGDAGRSQFTIYATLLIAMLVTFLALVCGTGTVLWRTLK